MDFDPAIEAQLALQRARAHEELGERWDEAEELESRFSSSTGPEASEAYHRLIMLGGEFAKAWAFQEFLIYITWQQVTERTIPEYFRQGTRLCDRFLAQPHPHVTPRSLAQIRTLRRSFREGLGLRDQDELGEEFDRDTFKGGD